MIFPNSHVQYDRMSSRKTAMLLSEWMGRILVLFDEICKNACCSSFAHPASMVKGTCAILWSRPPFITCAVQRRAEGEDFTIITCAVQRGAGEASSDQSQCVCGDSASAICSSRNISSMRVWKCYTRAMRVMWMCDSSAMQMYEIAICSSKDSTTVKERLMLYNCYAASALKDTIAVLWKEIFTPV